MSASDDLSAELRGAFDDALARAKASGDAEAFAAYATAECAPYIGGEAAAQPVAQPASGETQRTYGMIGQSAKMLAVYDLIKKVAPSSVPVLIQGETGTGKELVAKALHAASPRSAKRLLAENCAAVPENLLESELFGHKKGAFTGAVDDRPGHFVAADGGTVFLDEIGDMPLSMQAKLLRVLQDGEVRPVGANQSKKVDVRLVAATHRDLPSAVEAGDFRQDLLFRLNVVTIYLPALVDREGDIPRLAEGLLPGICEEVGRSAILTPEAIEALCAWRWPGNVRELENELRRAVALSDGTIRKADLSPRIL